MQVTRQLVSINSPDAALSGMLFLPEGDGRVPAVIVCHGAGEFKENHFELCELLAQRGIAALALDMHGHGSSSGDRFCVEIRRWVADVQAALDFLHSDDRIDARRIGAFGLSSGGTAILEAALVDSRLKMLVALNATVRNCLPVGLQVCIGFVLLAGRITKLLTGRDLRVPLNKFADVRFAADPEIDRSLQEDPRAQEALRAFPLPGGAEAFFVDTLKRVSGINVPTLVLWGEEDQIDPPETARLLYDALSCEKQLHIIPGNGHAGHLDRNKSQVFELTANWALKTLAS